jgi:hypothetical protein
MEDEDVRKMTAWFIIEIVWPFLWWWDQRPRLRDYRDPDYVWKFVGWDEYERRKKMALAEIERECPSLR